jgi:hypothetical protein
VGQQSLFEIGDTDGMGGVPMTHGLRFARRGGQRSTAWLQTHRPSRAAEALVRFIIAPVTGGITMRMFLAIATVYAMVGCSACSSEDRKPMADNRQTSKDDQAASNHEQNQLLPTLRFAELVEHERLGSTARMILTNSTDRGFEIGIDGDKSRLPEVYIPGTFHGIERYSNGEWVNISPMGDALGVKYVVEPGDWVWFHAQLPHTTRPGMTIRISIRDVASDAFVIPE